MYLNSNPLANPKKTLGTQIEPQKVIFGHLINWIFRGRFYSAKRAFSKKMVVKLGKCLEIVYFSFFLSASYRNKNISSENWDLMTFWKFGAAQICLKYTFPKYIFPKCICAKLTHLVLICVCNFIFSSAIESQWKINNG